MGTEVTTSLKWHRVIKLLAMECEILVYKVLKVLVARLNETERIARPKLR
jgi:hypothetical protein